MLPVGKYQSDVQMLINSQTNPKKNARTNNQEKKQRMQDTKISYVGSPTV